MAAEETGDGAPTSDDNLLTRHKHIAESIEMIRLKKDQLLRTLRGLSENEDPDRDLMAKLIDAFDVMTAQENSFLAVLKNIVQIHEQAANDLATENGELESKESHLNGEQGDVVDGNIEGDNGDDNGDEDMIRETLKELEQVSLQAIAAAELNEKLVETLQRHKKSRALMLEMRKDKTETLKSAVNAAIAEVKKAKKEVSINRAEIQKKQREAEELRKTALKAGIQVGADEQKHNDEVTAALNASVNDTDRIPPIPVMGKSIEDSKDGEEDPLEMRRKQIRENIRKEKERREHVNQTIREKLLAMEARKQRMKEIRRMLVKNQATASSLLDATKKRLETGSTQDESTKSDGASSLYNSTDSTTTRVCSEPTPQFSFEDGAALDEMSNEHRDQTRKDIEETFRSAEINLLNLTMLRQRLEEMQIRGENLSEDDANLISQLDDENEEVNELGKDDEHKINNSVHYSSGQEDLLSLLTDSDRIRNIEQMLLYQTSMLTELLRLNQPSNSRDDYGAVTVHPAVLLNVLVSTAPALLRVMSSYLLQLSDGVPVSQQLQRILNIICERYNIEQHETNPQGNIATDQIHQHQRNADVDETSVAVLTNRVSDLELKQTIRKTISAVGSILDYYVEIDKETEERLRDVVVSNVAAPFANVPRSMLDAQLGPLVSDVVTVYIHQRTDDVADDLCADIVRLLVAELDFYNLINSVNHIPDPYPADNGVR